MSGFISRAACSGRRPSQFAHFASYQRAIPMARLLKDRSIARFVVAPFGYGKTSLLVDYAETMFGWVHVFWINGASPCFIRDLDEGVIAADCKEVDADVRLVVFDDVPALDAERAGLLSGQIDELLEMGCEVIVACTPQCDVFGRLQKDRIRLGAQELLLDDEELDLERGREERMKQPSEQVEKSGRVPALVWGKREGDASAFVRGNIGEPMPADLLLCMGSMLVLGQGSFEMLVELGFTELDSYVELLSDYPHFDFDFDIDAGRFKAPSISSEDVAAGLKGRLDAMVAQSPYEAREQLVWAWADMLVSAEKAYGRACETVRFLCARIKRASWLAEHAELLYERGCFYEGLQLAYSLRAASKGVAPEDRAKCLAFESACRIVLGDDDEAIRCTKRLAFDETTPLDARICGLLIIARYGNEMLKARANACIEEISSANEFFAYEALSPWVLLASLWAKLESDPSFFSEYWSSVRRHVDSTLVLCLGATWLYSALAMRLSHLEEGEAPKCPDCSSEMERYVRTVLNESESGEPSYFAEMAGLALERAHMQGLPLVDGPLPARVLLMLRRCEMAVLAQKTRFDREWRGEAREGDSWDKGYLHGSLMPLSGITADSRRRSVPILKLKMFGRFEASIGDVPLENTAFRRKHVRLLLLLLCMNSGRDMSRAMLARTLWPDADEESARRNFYAAWSKMRRALMLSDGTCPYLVRNRYGCGLEGRYVQSDVARLGAICRELLFGMPYSQGWATLYTEIERDFSNELLPSESDDPVVMRARADCRSRLVDALVSATQSVIDAGDNQLAIWFARSAVGHDETREDAYVALMRAQIAAKQRTAAMMTYHTCRRALADNLGVNPSAETVELYETLLNLT